MNESNQFSRDAWEANAEVWDARMGDEGNDFFNVQALPNQTLSLVQSGVESDYRKKTKNIPPVVSIEGTLIAISNTLFDALCIYHLFSNC